MARIRTIKPEFWQDEDLAELSEPSLILAVGLLNHADDEGYFKAHPGLIRAAVFPIREPSMSIHGMLSELSEIGYIKVYVGKDGKKYGLITNFEKHQVISRPSKSKIKDLIDFNEDSLISHGELHGGTGNREQGKEGKGKDKTTVTQDARPRTVNGVGIDDIQAVFQTWQQYCEHPKAALDTSREKLISKWLKPDAYTVEYLCDAVRGCSITPHNMGVNDRNQRYDDLGLILRSADHIDRFNRNWHNPPAPRNDAEKRFASNCSAAQEAMRRLNQQGDVHAA